MTGMPGSPSAGTGGLSRATAALIGTATRATVAEQTPDITGISRLANGADQIFARAAAADADGKLEAIIPGTRYGDGALHARDRADPAARPGFGHQRGLLETAQRGRALPAVSACRSFF
jgi:hypothetical protein